MATVIVCLVAPAKYTAQARVKLMAKPPGKVFEISQVDVALLTTPPHFRPLHLEYAVTKGVHSFVEKPVATGVFGAHMLVALINDGPVTIFLDSHTRE